MSEPINEPILEMMYAFICNYIREKGFAPSIRDIARGCYMTPGNVHRYLDRLEGKRLITRQPGVARSIRLADHQDAE
ncbi:MAG: MarR family transcriptional regulator [Chloroflexi bacterium]|nr:MarR family transcriptional regulator [Chloroflexota bacterium]